MTVHRHLYVTGDRDEAELYLPRIREVATLLPDRAEAICHSELLALLYFLSGDLSRSFYWRRREIVMRRRLTREVLRSSLSDEHVKYLEDRGSSPGDFCDRVRIAMGLRSLLDQERPYAAGRLMSFVPRSIAEVPVARRDGGIRWLVLEFDSGSEGWFLFGHRSLEEAAEFDSWHLTRDEALGEAADVWGVSASDWKA